MKKLILGKLAWFALGAAGCLFAGCSPPGPSAAPADEGRPLRIAAAASLAELAADWGDLWGERCGERWDSAREVDVVAGASSTLARQVASGAPYDVFVSAHPDWVDWLEERQLLQAGTRSPVATNALVVVAPHADQGDEGGAGASFDAALLGSGRWALADPSHVPAGMFAREAVSQVVPWDSFEERVVPAADVRAALRLVETGALDRGIVYRTDAAAAPSVRVICEVPVRLHAPALVVAAALPRGGDDARALVQFLQSQAAREAAAARGFLPAE